MTKDPKDPDVHVWHQAMKDVTPLKRAKSAQKVTFSPKQVRIRPQEVGLDTFSNVQPSADLQKEPLDRSWQKRLRRGRMEVDMTLDLHGMTKDNAYSALMQAMERAILQQHRILLIVTGKGAPKVERDLSDDRPRGVLRKQVPLWLTDSRFANCIFAIRPAHPAHGGAGAYYILLRRPR